MRGMANLMVVLREIFFHPSNRVERTCLILTMESSSSVRTERGTAPKWWTGSVSSIGGLRAGSEHWCYSPLCGLVALKC